MRAQTVSLELQGGLRCREDVGQSEVMGIWIQDVSSHLPKMYVQKQGYSHAGEWTSGPLMSKVHQPLAQAQGKAPEFQPA